MVSLELDPQGRLIRFHAVPSQLDSGNPPAQKMEWNKLFEAAGLDPLRWTPAEPREIPLFSFDERAAWTGTYAHAPQMSLRIEAAAWKGRPVSFEVFGPWRRPARMPSPDPLSVAARFATLAGATVICIFLPGAIWLAWLNLRQGRGDTRGSLRLATAALVCYSLAFFVQMHHVLLPLEFAHIGFALAIGLLAAAVVWVLYMALEPYLRRRLPQSLISWTRVLSGDFRDPLVAGHILAGAALGVGGCVLFRAGRWAAWQRDGVLALSPYTINTLNGAGLARGLLASPISVIVFAMFALLLFLLFRALLRNTWLTAAALIPLVVFAVIVTAPPGYAAIAFLFSLPVLWVMIRFGVLPCVLMLLVASTTSNWPLTSDFSAWYADKGLIVVALVLALAVWSFRNALGGRKVLRDDLL